MSSLSTPITSRQFAEAVHSLPLANLHFIAAEIRNSIAHLESSNQQLQPIADNGDLDCREAIEENAVVMKRMEERVLLLKNEVEGRGFKWGEDEPGQLNIQTNGHEEAGFTRPTTLTAPATEQGTGPSGGSLGDEELARRLRERMEEDEGVDADGVHL